jgi:hypothetical protein
VGRNMLAEREGVRKAQDASVYILGWIAQILSITAGSFAANSWPGKVIRWVVELFPAWVLQLALVIGFAAWFIDIINDLTPNQTAITYGFLGPILAASNDSNGTLAERVREWSNLLRDSLGDATAQWVGNVGPGPLSIALMAVAVIIGKRVLQKQAAGAGRGGGGPR